MNITYIVLLPVEVLRQIPTTYRLWKLLQMTCHTIMLRLGDYHKARGVRALANGCIEMSYKDFESNLIMQIASYRGGSKCALFYGCERNADGSIVRTSTDRYFIIEWDSDTLLSYDRDSFPYCQYITRYDSYESTSGSFMWNVYIIICGVAYFEGAECDNIRLLYEHIYNELPNLYRVMLTTRSMSAADFCRQ